MFVAEEEDAEDGEGDFGAPKEIRAQTQWNQVS